MHLTDCLLLLLMGAHQANPEPHCNAIPTPQSPTSPPRGQARVLPLPQYPYLDEHQSLPFKPTCVFQMCPTFPLRLLSLLPKILFFTLLHFLKFYLSLKGILRCYHLHEVFPDSSSQPLADDGVPSFLSRLSLQMPAISPIDTFYLCLLWL